MFRFCYREKQEIYISRRQEISEKSKFNKIQFRSIPGEKIARSTELETFTNKRSIRNPEEKSFTSSGD